MDFKTIFGEEALTLAQFQEKVKDMKLVDLSGGEYVAKGKYDGDLKKAKDDLAEAKKTIASLEASKGDTAALEAEIQRYKDADAQREKEAQEAKAKADMDARFTAVLGDKEFASDFARDGVYSRFAAAVNDPTNKGKGDNELFASLTKDVDGVFKSKNPPVRMGGIKTGTPGMTREQIFAIKDRTERQAAIAANLNLFNKGE